MPPSNNASQGGSGQVRSSTPRKIAAKISSAAMMLNM
jgi:hypothetical protein